MTKEKKTIDPNYLEVSNLFNGSCVYQVPKYQRGYAWEATEVEEFCNDLFECLDAYENDEELEHFFGGVVCIEEKPDSPKQTHKCFSVVDGQQRISTFILFISVIRDCLLTIHNDIEDKYKNGVNTLIDTYEKKYLYYSESRNLEEIKYEKLRMSIKDEEFYHSLVYKRQLLPQKTDSHKRIQKAQKLIKSKIEHRIDKLDFIETVQVFEKIDALLSSKCHLLKITTNKNEDAYRLFQVLNDRGRALSACDLLRATSLSKFEANEYIGLQDKAAVIWDEITEDRERDVEKYFSFYYVSQAADKIKKLDLFSKFNKLFFENSNPEGIYTRLQNISEQLDTIKLLEDGEWPYEKSNLSQWHHQRAKFLVVRLKHTECIPLLLAATQLSETKFYELVRVLEKFFFRFKTVLGKRFDPVVKVYLEEIKKINKNPQTYGVQSITKELRNVLESRTTNEEFIHAVLQLEFSTKESKDATNGNRVIKYLLLQLEENYDWLRSENPSIKSRENMVDKSHVYDFPFVSIEHVYPCTPKKIDKDIDSRKHKLENLTVLARDTNSLVGNKGFQDKKVHFAASKYKLNKEIANYNTWDNNTLAERKTQIENSLVELFRI
ncbi:hypothetical protein GCM10008107_16620 [Psychrosphaera saromensis]|uniref:DUF262 domain-containing protein n=1 Tax=Psychrosphaera saromensis TaxID=716813 RepID=A0A2S7UT57_9GAMM|nr:DUF262 domain-containing protein [Psychrosphaera saromensis]PQJ53127.1 hypothetical protein BTO11_05260 [Psychrosphaera saromensis]GHB67833.1 hypothetical protein GCM10008107_16620 [Psychrosphaera saromensis]GLQ15118.1 hypothetical protein GCM10007917_25730 [Psychrosphaera saromensis]